MKHSRHDILWALVENQIDTTDLAHDHLHVKRVYQWALRIAEDLNADQDLCGAAAILHDIVNIPKESVHRSMGSELSAIKGAQYLPKAGYSESETAKIVEGIRTCSWSKGLQPTNIIGKVLQDADRLDAIGAIGIARNIACAQAMSSRGSEGNLYHETDPVYQIDRDLNDKRYAMDHFTIKLLKLAQTMHSNLAKDEAIRRHNFLVTFLEELERDVL
jgi:uncharacterized protein